MFFNEVFGKPDEVKKIFKESLFKIEKSEKKDDFVPPENLP